MKLSFFCTPWGAEFQTIGQFLESVQQAGYDGVELSFPEDWPLFADAKSVAAEVKSAGLTMIAQHWETVCPDFKQHKRELERRMWRLVETEPKFINSQTGRDFFSFEQSLALIDLCAEIEAQSGVPIIHETHRGRFNFAAHITEQFINERPQIKLTADFSHWCCVAGNLLEEQQVALQKAIACSQHIHTRVGFSEGPQVNDPAAPEWHNEVNTHLAWWRSIVDAAKQKGQEEFTFLAEFGPAPYMPCMPYSQKPLANQWEVNCYMKELVTRRLSAE